MHAGCISVISFPCLASPRGGAPPTYRLFVVAPRPLSISSAERPAFSLISCMHCTPVPSLSLIPPPIRTLGHGGVGSDYLKPGLVSWPACVRLSTSFLKELLLKISPLYILAIDVHYMMKTPLMVLLCGN
jgi:hypothetical protein